MFQCYNVNEAQLCFSFHSVLSDLLYFGFACCLPPAALVTKIHGMTADVKQCPALKMTSQKLMARCDITGDVLYPT